MDLIKNSRIARSLFIAFILSFCMGTSTLAQQVEGKVMDESGETLPGVNITVKGTEVGTTTGSKGKYQLKVPSLNETLVFSFVGFQTQEIAINGREKINVTLLLKTYVEDELVVVGYGSQSKSDLTGSVSSVSSDDLDNAVYNTVDQTLQGRVSGAFVVSSSGEPGGDISVRIRGNNSLSGSNEPLYVIDGTPIAATGDAAGVAFGNSDSPLKNLNPENIERIEVLKDASATAIYGSRGANGVVLITTKGGKSGKTEITVSNKTTISEVIQKYDMLNGTVYARYRNEAKSMAGLSEPFSNPDQYQGKGFNWQDEIMRTGIRQNYGLSIAGGNPDVRYYISGNLLNHKGIILGSEFKRGNLRANIDVDSFDDKLNIELNLSATQINKHNSISQSRGFPDAAGPIFNALTAQPIVPSKNFTGFTQENQQFYNPYLQVTEKTDKLVNTNILGGVNSTYKITSNFSYSLNASVDFKLSNRDMFFPSSVSAGVLNNGSATSNQLRSYNYVVSNYLNYKNTLFRDHKLDVTAGLEYSEFNNHTIGANVTNFELDILGIDALQVGSSLNDINSSRSLSVLKSGFLRVNYTFADRYLLTLTGRADGSSRFAKNNKWGFFPSAALAWRVSEENFLNDSDIISNLKLRASYGETGSQSIAPYQSLARFTTINYGVGNSPTLGYAPVSVANNDLKWETTRQFDTGFDIGLLENKIEFSFDYYIKKTTDLLQSISIPSQSGFTSTLVNFGSNQNKGIELSLNAYPSIAEDFQWSTGLNFTSYKTKILELGGDEEIFGPALGVNLSSTGHIFKKGLEYGMFYGYNTIGLIQESDFDENGNIVIPVYNNDDQPGHWKYEDKNGDGIITPDDRMVIGNPNPDFVFGWNNDFSYKNFTLNVFIQGVYGNDIYNILGTVLNSGFQNDEAYKNQTRDWYENRWTPENPHNNTKYPSINSGPGFPAASHMVEDGSYIRLKSITLRYDVPINNLPLAGLQLSVTSTNLYTLTNYTGYDPEVSQFGSNNLAPGVDLGAYPRQKSITFGINAKF